VQAELFISIKKSGNSIYRKMQPEIIDQGRELPFEVARISEASRSHGEAQTCVVGHVCEIDMDSLHG